MLPVGIIGAGDLGRKLYDQLSTVAFLEPALYDKEPRKFASILDVDDELSLQYLVRRKRVIISTIKNIKIEEECRKQNKPYIDGRSNPHITPADVLFHINTPLK